MVNDDQGRVPEVSLGPTSLTLDREDTSSEAWVVTEDKQSREKGSPREGLSTGTEGNSGKKAFCLD
jgi:hypothetical protein